MGRPGCAHPGRRAGGGTHHPAALRTGPARQRASRRGHPPLMVTFLLLAGILIIAGVAVIAIPLLRRLPTQIAPAPWTALVAAGVLVIGSAVMYAALTNWSWR